MELVVIYEVHTNIIYWWHNSNEHLTDQLSHI